MYIHRTSVEIIKLSLAASHRYYIPCKDVLIGSISWLLDKYEATENKLFLQKAIQHIYAYIELGFDYEKHPKLFRTVADKLGVPAEELFPESIWKYTKIKLSKTGIHNLLGRWNPGLQSMKVNQVIDDIYRKVSNRIEGEYLYHSGKIVAQDEEDVLWEQTFRLYVKAEEAIFYDVNKNKYYLFE